MEPNKKHWRLTLSIFIMAIILIFIYKTLDNFGQITDWVKQLIDILMPFIIGTILAYILYSPCKRMEEAYLKSKNKFLKKRARGFGVLTVYLLAVLLIVLIVNFVVPIFSESISDLIDSLPTYYENAKHYVENIPKESILNNDVIKTNLQKALSSVNINSIVNMDNITSYAKGILGLASAIFEIFVAIIISIYILLDRRNIINFLSKLSNGIFKSQVSKGLSLYFGRANTILLKFITGQLLDGLVMACLASLLFMILDVQYAVLLGFMIGLFNLIPYFGAIIAIGISFLITIFTGGIGLALSSTVIVVILQQVDSNVINPRIIGNYLDIRPLLVIFAVTVGGGFFGMMGMFLAVPIAVLIRSIVIEYLEHKKEREE